jgi:hypothetical protein
MQFSTILSLALAGSAAAFAPLQARKTGTAIQVRTFLLK